MAVAARHLLKGVLLLGAVNITLSACGQSDGGGTGTGGKTTSTGGTGGSTAGATGGAAGGGGSATGGSSASGGATGSGGAGGKGGSASGGTTGSGGAVASGGSHASGGTTGVATGGSTGGAGTQATGGAGAGGIGGKGGAGGGGSSGNGGAGPQLDGGPADSAAGGSTGGNGSGGIDGGPGGSTGTVTCPTTVLKSGETTKTVAVGSDSRTYILHVPSKYDGTKPMPFVVDFHPIGGTGSGEDGSSPYKALTDAEGVITAYPNGKSGPMGGAWNVGPCCVAGVDDVAFAKALVADVEKVACVDPKRVYAVGFSMGGGMSHYVACHAADVFAAVAPAAFDLLKENEADCKPPRPITVISFRSTGDNVVAYNGGASSVVSGMPITFLGAKGTFKKWAEIDQCTGSPSAEDSNGCSTYSSCAGGVQVTLCTKQGGTHEAGNASVGWPLLKKYTLP